MLKFMETILKVRNLTKRYHSFTAVNSISFEVKEGEVVGLLGPNGAGKTTTIQMLLSLVEPSSGAIEIFGKNLRRERVEILRKMNFVAPYAPLPYHLSIWENLTVFSLLYNVPLKREERETLLKEFQLNRFRNQRSGALSSGEQMRLQLAKAFLNNPKLLLLDEPTASLDPAIAKTIRSQVYYRMKQSKGAILWTSHNMREIEAMCDRVIFLSHGAIIADDTPQNILERFQKQDLEEVFVSLFEKQETAEHAP